MTHQAAGRIPKLAPDQLDPEQRALYDAIAGGPRAQGPRLFRLTDDAGALEGPFNAMLLRPALGQALQELGAALRYRGGLSDRARELVILAVAAHHDSDFERYAHQAVGAHAGLGPQEIEAVDRGQELDHADPAEGAALQAARRLLDTGTLDDSDYARAESALGAAGVFEVTTLVGYYALLATQLRVFGVTSAPPD